MKNKINLKSLMVIVLIMYACYIFVNQQITMNKFNNEIAAKKQELQKLKDKNEKLQDEVNMTKTDMYIEMLARERNFIKEGETPVINSK